jgi:hypothetical protein
MLAGADEFCQLLDAGCRRYDLRSGDAAGGGDVGAWLKEARLELGSNAWAGVEDFNWLKKVIVVIMVAAGVVVMMLVTVTVMHPPTPVSCAGEEPELVGSARG